MAMQPTHYDIIDRHNSWWPLPDEILVPADVVQRRGNTYGGLFKYPFNELAVGQSFRTEGGNRGTMTVNARKHRRKHGWRFLVRQFQNGIRVTRIE